MAAITKAPSWKVSNLTVPKRVGGTFSTSWKVPNGATKESDPGRWQNIVVLWTITYNVKENGAYKVVKVLKTLAASATSSTTTLNPANLYPAVGGAEKQVRSVSIRVRAKNSKGYGPNVDATLNMAAPDKPALSMSFNASTGKVTASVTCKNVDGAKHRYDSIAWIKREGVGGTAMLVNGSHATDTTRNLSQDISNASTLTAGQVVKVTCTVRNRGMGGDSATVTKNYVICHPNRPLAGKPSLSYATKGVLTTASVVVPVTNQGIVTLKDGTKVYPTQLKLQRLKGSESTNSEDAAAEEGWQDVDGAVDNGNCAGLMDTWSDGVSQDGLRTWYRVAALRDGYTQYGPPTFAQCLFTAAPTVTAGAASISSAACTDTADGVRVWWKRKDYSNGGGIELSWSDSADAWNSTTGPNVYELDTDAASGVRTIDSLTANTDYYIRVRPYVVDASGEKKYGKYSLPTTITVAASIGSARITNITETADMTGVALTMTKTQADDAVEISWSDKFDAWTSNKEPETTITDAGWTRRVWYVYGLDVGVNYYFRVRTVDGETYGSYGDKVCYAIEPHTYSVGTAKVTSAVTGEDGETVIVKLSKSRDGDGAELSWSDDSDAWDSTDKPSSFEVEDWNGKTATVHVKGLEEGTRYYFRARAYEPASSPDLVYSDWSAKKTATPYGPTGTVSASVPDVVVRGRALPVSWTHDGTGKQREWKVQLDGKVVASGTGTRTAANIPAATTRDLTTGEHTVVVSVTAGSDWSKSNACSVNVAVAPTATFSAPSTLTTQPMAITYTGTKGCTVGVVITAQGCAADDLHDAQPSGLVVWSGSFPVSGTMAALTLPSDVDFRDGASYDVSVTVTNEATGLSTELSTQTVPVAWLHQAVAPDATVTVDAEEMSADIVATAPEGASSSDVVDVWRVTPDGTYLIAEGRAFGEMVHDRYAPFCEPLSDWQCAYRVVTRTTNGDTDFTDAPYELRSDRLRIDWGIGRSVELEYSLSGSDGWAKDFSAITHLDGTQGGSWARGVKRTAKLSGVMVRTATSEQQAMLRELAQWAGPAFVRASNGSAYMANVTVSALAFSSTTFKVTATVSAQELELTDEFKADPVEEVDNG